MTLRITVLSIVSKILAFAGGVLLIACGTPTEPSRVAPSTGGAVVHDSLNPAGDQSNLNGGSAQPYSGFDYRSFDDFVSPTTTSISTVSWQGVYCMTAFTAAVPPATSTGFDVVFYADRGTFPAFYADDAIPQSRVPLYETSYGIGQVNERVAGVVNTAGACGRYDTPVSTAGLYDYSVTLPRSFNVVAGTRYWLRIQTHNPNPSVSWAWRYGTSDNNRAALVISSSLYMTQRDLAFSLR